MFSKIAWSSPFADPDELAATIAAGPSAVGCSFACAATGTADWTTAADAFLAACATASFAAVGATVAAAPAALPPLTIKRRMMAAATMLETKATAGRRHGSSCPVGCLADRLGLLRSAGGCPAIAFFGLNVFRTPLPPDCLAEPAGDPLGLSRSMPVLLGSPLRDGDREGGRFCLLFKADPFPSATTAVPSLALAAALRDVELDLRSLGATTVTYFKRDVAFACRTVANSSRWMSVSRNNNAHQQQQDQADH